MNVYFSGAGGVGIGPLMEIAHDAGYQVTGSDTTANLMTEQLEKRGLKINIGQTDDFIAKVHQTTPLDWFVYTSALPPNHPELIFAREHRIRTSKRDEFLSHVIKTKDLKLIAVAGTHGKTTTTGILVWAFQRLGFPLSYSVGTTLSFGQSGRFDAESQFFVYECDEYDRNFLHYYPYLSLIASVDHDHFDTYPNLADYQRAFVQFIEQSTHTLLWERDLRTLKQPDIGANYEAYDELMDLSYLKLAGDHVRHNAFLVERALIRLFPEANTQDITKAINSFPGTDRRFEKLADGLYSDYGHHPTEIASTLQLAHEISEHVVLVYQPHQNVRQHEIRHLYTDCMKNAETIYWLPTYLSREDARQEVLAPEQLFEQLDNRSSVVPSQMDSRLWQNIQLARKQGKLVVVMGAGSIDNWLRNQLRTS